MNLLDAKGYPVLAHLGATGLLSALLKGFCSTIFQKLT